MANNENGKLASVEVLAERIANLSKKVDEQAASQKAAVDAALLTSQTAITVALATQEKTVNAAFAASEKAITKAEESQKEYNKTTVELQKDIVGLKESRSQSRGSGNGMRDMYGWFAAGIIIILAILGYMLKVAH